MDLADDGLGLLGWQSSDGTNNGKVWTPRVESQEALDPSRVHLPQLTAGVLRTTRRHPSDRGSKDHSGMGPIEAKMGVRQRSQ